MFYCQFSNLTEAMSAQNYIRCQNVNDLLKRVNDQIIAPYTTIPLD